MKRSSPRSTAALLVSVSIIASALSVPASAQGRVEVGNAASVVGSVEIQASAKAKKRKLARKQRVAWGDIITTSKKSQAQLLLLDRSSFGIGTKSRVRIDKFVYDPNKDRSFTATLLKGALRFFSGRKGRKQSGEVKTSSGRIGIRGTAVDMFAGPKAVKVGEHEDALKGVKDKKDEATMVILRGPGVGTAGELTQGLVEVEAAGVTVVLDEPGLAAYIPRIGAAPIGPFRISDRGLLRSQNRLAPEVKRANDGGGLLGDLLPVAAGLGAAAAAVLISQDGEEVPGVIVNPNDSPVAGCDDPDANGVC
ncbi:MAG: FecR family protein [Marinomonas sp.]